MTEPLIAIIAALLGFLAAFLSARGEIVRLREENADLLGCLYHRIGYKPQTKHREDIIVPDAERVTPPVADSFPDLLTLQECARND